MFAVTILGLHDIRFAIKPLYRTRQEAEVEAGKWPSCFEPAVAPYVAKDKTNVLA